MNKRTLALFSATALSIMYGLSFTISKDVMPDYIKPFGFILIRVFGATILFWLISIFGPKETILVKDFPRIIAASFFGVALNMLTFFKGLSLTTPISGAVIMVTTPVIVLLLSSIIIKEKFNFKKFIGILLGLLGTGILILYGKSIKNAPNAALGNILVFVNAVSYAFYLIIVKKLMDKYNALTFVKWIYTFGLIMVIPFGWNEYQEIKWNFIPNLIFLEVIFVVIFTTFFTYLLNLISMRELKPTTVAVFIYLQPLFATLFALFLGKDHLTWIKIISAILIFTGVFLVTKKKS
jgi:drug/metabolite transporter (DMT)-like permease